MNKNGFIATSLIYTFFIMFVVLFSTVMADYIQNKVLLETTEKSIKDDLNTIITIRDFEIGSMLAFVENCNNVGTSPIYIVANKNVLNNTIVLYSTKLYKLEELQGFYNGWALLHDDIINDISQYGSYFNETYFNKIIYTFEKNEKNSYKLGENYYIYKKENANDNSKCICDFQDTTDPTICLGYTTDKWCITNDNTNSLDKYRHRMTKTINTSLNKCNIETGDGTLYIRSS